MSTHRRQVFIDKVRKRLFPSVPSSPEKETPQSLALETPPKNITSETVQQKDDVDALHHLTEKNSGINLVKNDLNLPDQQKRRRSRKHKSKKKLK
uniref:Uncharacterized protein n=1 Tax=Jaculus jaculus TaxID=51337 RepID=A0A8C5LBY2_JACJA